jgi:hypothetical protein
MCPWLPPYGILVLNEQRGPGAASDLAGSGPYPTVEDAEADD